ncbi:unnamed protein product [Sphagnum balticum]
MNGVQIHSGSILPQVVHDTLSTPSAIFYELEHLKALAIIMTLVVFQTVVMTFVLLKRVTKALSITKEDDGAIDGVERRCIDEFRGKAGGEESEEKKACGGSQGTGKRKEESYQLGKLVRSENRQELREFWLVAHLLLRLVTRNV